MNSDLDDILAEISRRLDRAGGVIEAPFLYLDPHVVSYLFQELTGFSEYPEIRYGVEANQRGPRVIPPGGEGITAPPHLVYKAMIPKLSQRIPQVRGSESLVGLKGRFARISGELRSTRFPDGLLNLEIVFGDVRGVLFYTEEFISSMLRPLLAHDRFHEFQDRVDALVCVHGPLRKTIFYHQSYGDNQEHAWVPLVPVVIETNADDDALTNHG